MSEPLQPTRQITGSEQKDSKRENREIPPASKPPGLERSVNATGGTTDIDAGGHCWRAPPGSNAGRWVRSTCEVGEQSGHWRPRGADGGKGPSREERRAACRTPDIEPNQTCVTRTAGRAPFFALLGAARKDRTLVFENLLHHVSEDCLRDAFFNLKETAAVGVDEVTWHEYERNLDDNIVDLHGRVHRGAYRAKPSKRV